MTSNMKSGVLLLLTFSALSSHMLAASPKPLAVGRALFLARAVEVVAPEGMPIRIDRATIESSPTERPTIQYHLTAVSPQPVTGVSICALFYKAGWSNILEVPSNLGEGEPYYALGEGLSLGLDEAV